jgi:hypothetical protein
VAVSVTSHAQQQRRQDQPAPQGTQLIGVITAGGESGDDGHRLFALAQVVPGWLPGRRRDTPDTEEVVDGLEGKSQMRSVVA